MVSVGRADDLGLHLPHHHPRTEPRLWPWLAWVYGLDGLYLPEAKRWHSDIAHCAPSAQNPWGDPMTRQSEVGLLEGAPLAVSNSKQQATQASRGALRAREGIPRMKHVLTAFSLWAALAITNGPARPAHAADANLLPNPSFEFGQVAPDNWRVFALGEGLWEFNGHQGERCVSVTGDGSNVSWWTVSPLTLGANRIYQFSFWARRAPNARGGTAISGLESVNCDFSAGVEWERREFCFRTPDLKRWEPVVRLGQWHVNGTYYFDDVSLTPAVVVHARPRGLGLPLGEGESLVAGEYTATHLLGGPGLNDCRFLERFDASFNTKRWVFGGPASVVYVHRVGRLRQRNASVEVNVNRCEAGELIVEASTDGETWRELGRVGGVKRAQFPVTGVVPEREVWVRLRTDRAADIQVDDYRYRSRIDEAASIPPAIGCSRYLGVAALSPELQVEVRDLGDLLPGGRSTVELVVGNTGPRRLLRVALTLEQNGAPVSRSEQAIAAGPGSRNRVALGYGLEAAGDYGLEITCVDATDSTVLWKATGGFNVPALHDARGGELLSDTPQAALWWCEPERKVSRERPAPKTSGRALRISAAGGEYEPAQLVVRPHSGLSGCRLSATELVGPGGARIPASAIEIRTVAYVPVQQPTDEVGSPGDWPDPLPPQDGPMDLAAEVNQPFWITVHVPRGAPAGDYRGEVIVAANGDDDWARVPFEVHVWGFDLPEQTHVRSGFGLSEEAIREYHNLETDEEVARVAELYRQSFASHRVCPYSVGADIGVEWKQVAQGRVEPQLDFTAFDAAAHHALDELGFNSFTLELAGLGGGTFHARHLGEIAGHQQGTPAHEEAFTRYVRAVQAHLEQKGWLDKAYVYWFDEPAERDFDFVRDGMQLIRRAGPKLKRMLTTRPTPELYGAVDLWCIPTYLLDPEVVRERQAEGEEIWWYLCTAPKAPYFTLFLDHYGTEMRLWLWESWKYGVTGILVWATNYWTSGNAYPRPALQNPWQDPMSWTSGYGLEVGERQPWGNGDGRFFYPPTRDPGNDTRKYIQGPIPSIRWEALRDGIEDYEYFWLLRSEVQRLRKAGADPSVVRDAELLLEVPADVCADLTHFTTTPEPIHQHRAKVAEAIERLKGM